MNKKLIAVAVAGVVAAPAAYADISAYGRINNGIQITEDAAGDNTTDMETFGSRFGFKGSGDIGNGMEAFARYEFSTNTDTAGGGSGIGRRLAYVGLSGPVRYRFPGATMVRLLQDNWLLREFELLEWPVLDWYEKGRKYRSILKQPWTGFADSRRSR